MKIQRTNAIEGSNASDIKKELIVIIGREGLISKAIVQRSETLLGKAGRKAGGSLKATILQLCSELRWRMKSKNPCRRISN